MKSMRRVISGFGFGRQNERLIHQTTMSAGLLHSSTRPHFGPVK
jgi:hypothetical protein